KLTGEGNHVNAVAFSPDGRALLGAVMNGPVAAWNVATGKPLPGLPGNPRGVCALAFSADGKLLATGSRDFRREGEVHVWDWPARKGPLPHARPPEPHPHGRLRARRPDARLRVGRVPHPPLGRGHRQVRGPDDGRPPGARDLGGLLL